MKIERRYDIDWLRVIAIGLLLIYHIAIVFQPWAMFIGFIRSNESIESLWKMMSVINVWRIPLLFFVSGMGVYFAMQKRNWKQLLFERSRRILFPFIFGIVAITPLHMYVFQTFYNLPLGYHFHTGHLWFLGNIFVYVLCLLPLFYHLNKNEGGKFKSGLSIWVRHPIGLLSISTFFVLEAIVLKPQLYELYANTWHGFALGFLAFFFGFILMYSGKTFWQNVLTWRWLYIGIACVLCVLRLFVSSIAIPNYLMALESNVWIFGMFGFCYKYLNKPSVVLNYLSKAVYPIYIIHMVGLYIGAMIILPLDIHPLLKFVAIVLFTGGSCFLVYEYIIRRIAFLRPLFGLKCVRE